MLVFVLNQAQKANTGKIQTPVYENVREFGEEKGCRSAALFRTYLRNYALMTNNAFCHSSGQFLCIQRGIGDDANNQPV